MVSRSEDFANEYGGFGRHYSDTGFWSWIKNYALDLGREGLRHALTLYYTLEEPSVPTWAKTVIIGALGYLIFPLDAIPDFIPVIGLTDDLAVLIAAIGVLELHVTEGAREKADLKIQDWFGK